MTLAIKYGASMGLRMPLMKQKTGMQNRTLLLTRDL